MKIYHVHETWVDEWDTDPDRGMVKVRRSVMQPSNMHSLTFGGTEYPIGRDGAFDVPEEVAQFFVGPPVTRAGWHTGVPPFRPDEEAPTAAEAAPRVVKRRRAAASV